MYFNRFAIFTIARVLIMALTIVLLSWIWGDERLFFTQIILGIIILLEIAELIRFVNQTNREITRFLDAIKHEDFSVSFKKQKLGLTFADLHVSMANIIDAYNSVKIEKEAQYHLLQFLVQRISIGIIFLNDDEISLINPKACELLQTDSTKSWKVITQKIPKFADEVAFLGGNGRKLVEIKQHSETKILSLDVSSQIILEKPGKLITIQDINSEIDQKEIEAWHKLIRILTHEIMNSITPISSLTETMQGMLKSRSGEQKKVTDLDDETVSDMLFSLKTINTRSDGLLHFVENYRKLSRVPKPQRELVSIQAFVSEMDKLLRDTLERQHIKFIVSCEDNLVSEFDPALIQQVIINLVTNSTHALLDSASKEIELKAYRTSKKLTFEIKDNGIGIPEKELSEIFIPFFSTKKEGSGIGLSLSKQIITSHGGTLKVNSILGEGTTFFIVLDRKDG